MACGLVRLGGGEGRGQQQAKPSQVIGQLLHSKGLNGLDYA